METKTFCKKLLSIPHIFDNHSFAESAYYAGNIRITTKTEELFAIYASTSGF